MDKDQAEDEIAQYFQAFRHKKIQKDVRKHVPDTQLIQLFINNNSKFMEQESNIPNRKILNLLVSSGRNVCLHGYGSKQSFALRTAKSSSRLKILQIRGYHPAIRFKDIVKQIYYNLNQQDQDCQLSLVQQINFIKSRTKLQLLVLFHNLDGVNFLALEQQQQISNLFQSKAVQLLATIDSIKFGHAISSQVLRRYRFHFVQINTYKIYNNQLMDEFSNQFQFVKREDGLSKILNALEPNAIKLLRTLIIRELQCQVDQVFHRMLIREMLELCISESILCSEQQLIHILGSLKANRLLKQTRTKQGVEYQVRKDQLSLNQILKFIVKYQQNDMR